MECGVVWRDVDLFCHLIQTIIVEQLTARSMKFHQQLNQPARSMKWHGKHRRAGKAAHGDSIVRTDYSSGVPDYVTLTISSGGTIWAAWTDAFKEPDPPAIPYAGIRAGEIIGYRAWMVVSVPPSSDVRLCSLAHGRVWETAYMDGNLSEKVSSSLGSTIWGGVYAFSSAKLVHEEMRESTDLLAKTDLPRPYIWDWDQPIVCLHGIAIGTVKMWGDVIEHEKGYRAEHVKIISLDEAFGCLDIGELRNHYGLR